MLYEFIDIWQNLITVIHATVDEIEITDPNIQGNNMEIEWEKE